MKKIIAILFAAICFGSCTKEKTVDTCPTAQKNIMVKVNTPLSTGYNLSLQIKDMTTHEVLYKRDISGTSGAEVFNDIHLDYCQDFYIYATPTNDSLIGNIYNANPISRYNVDSSGYLILNMYFYRKY